MKKILTVLFSLCLLVGCSSNSSNAIEGKWRLTEMSYEETVIDANEIYPAGIFYTFNEDGTLTVDHTGTTTNSTWSQTDETYTMHLSNGDIKATIEDGVLKCDFEGAIYTMELVD